MSNGQCKIWLGQRQDEIALGRAADADETPREGNVGADRERFYDNSDLYCGDASERWWCYVYCVA